MKKTAERLDEMTAAMELIADTKLLMEEYDVEISDEARASYTSLAAQLEELKALVAMCQDALDNLNKTWAKTVEDEIPVLKKQVVELHKGLQDEMYFKRDTDLGDMCSHLTTLQETFNQHAGYTFHFLLLCLLRIFGRLRDP